MRVKQDDSRRVRDSYTVAVLDKAIDLLECMADGEGWSVARLSAKTGMTKTSVYRIITTLQSRGYLSRDPDRRDFLAGPALLALARLLINNTALTALSRGVLVTLSEELGETINLAVLDRNRIRYVDMVECDYALRMSAEVGSTGPAYCTALGKAMLSRLATDEARSILTSAQRRPYTQHTKVGLNEVLEELEITRARGYAVDNEENEIGARCIGAPICDAGGRPIAAVSASGPAWRIPEEKIPRIALALQRGAEEIERQCGYRPAAKAQ